ncbi:helix-turn-helix domain-containing protein [Streptomyces sp. NBC_00063]|uniref:helix-turn-helix domain-containing protein n=1 Tax=Streptomyces sp. NBC_00063 TaxID=2975638 RepID=UPI003D74E01A
MARFTDTGYDRPSLREIADHLGVTKAAVYHHFKPKEDILAALFAQWIHSIEDLISWTQAQPPRPENPRQGAAPVCAHAGAVGATRPAPAAESSNSARPRGQRGTPRCDGTRSRTLPGPWSRTHGPAASRCEVSEAVALSILVGVSSRSSTRSGDLAADSA